MRSILPRYPNKSITLGMDLFPVDKPLVNEGKTLIRNPFTGEMVAATAATLPAPPEPKDPNAFWTTPFGATLGLGLVAGGLYYLAKNMGVTSK